MEAYRSRYAELEKAGATLLAVSMDDRDTLQRFKEELKAPQAFVPDPEGKLTAIFDAKMPLVKAATRATFVIGPDRKVVAIQTGKEAIDPGGAILACPLRRPDAGT